VSDLFAYWTINEWREAVLNKIWKGYEHIQFQLLTKEPQNIISYRGVRKPIFDYDYPKNFWIGCTVTDNSQIWKIEEIKKIKCGVRFVSFEPLLEDLPVLDLSGIDWVIIGALTGSEKFPIKQEWVDNIYQRASRYGIPVFIKDNVKKSLGCDGVLKQFPK
jgi:protein gp37